MRKSRKSLWTLFLKIAKGIITFVLKYQSIITSKKSMSHIKKEFPDFYNLLSSYDLIATPEGNNSLTALFMKNI